ncbi:hypothetical protein GCM10029978_022670 [Actinoallomurus acanthiterrae]
MLAREGARGLTFRAVDAQAAVPTGTASNYFANRDDLMTQIGGRIHERLQPDATTVVALYLAMNWLIVERLTLPEVFPEAELHDLVTAVVDRVLPADGPDGPDGGTG